MVAEIISGTDIPVCESRAQTGMSVPLHCLGRETAAAAAGLHHIRIVEREAAAFEAVVKVDRRAVEIEGALLIDGDFQAVMLFDLILGVVGIAVEAERVLKAAASAGRDADAENRRVGQLLLADDAPDFAGCFFRQSHRHYRTFVVLVEAPSATDYRTRLDFQEL